MVWRTRIIESILLSSSFLEVFQFASGSESLFWFLFFFRLEVMHRLGVIKYSSPFLSRELATSYRLLYSLEEIKYTNYFGFCFRLICTLF